MIARVQQLANLAAKRGELPIATLVSCSRYQEPLAEAYDTRNSTGNFLCHAAANIIDAVSTMDLNDTRPVDPEQPIPYLLSGLSVFTTHEPCLMCSMSLLHSRVAAVYYIRAADGAGGLGSCYKVHEDRGLNHKFEVWEWHDNGTTEEVAVDP